MADHRDPLCVDVAVRLEVVERARKAPSPGPDGSPFVRLRTRLPWLVEERKHALAEIAGMIWSEIAAIDRRDAVPAPEDCLDRPALRIRAARRVRCAVVHDARSIRHPVLRDRDV